MLYKIKNARAKSLLKTVFKKVPVKTCKGHIFWVLGCRQYKIIEDPKANILLKCYQNLLVELKIDFWKFLVIKRVDF